MSYVFDGANKTITPGDTASFSVADLYSRWKDWVQESDNSKYAPAFRSVAGDPISDTQNIAPYIFLNTTDGWRIRPFEADYELNVTGNLYSEDPDLPLFIPTIASHTVTITIDRSASAIAVTVGGIDQATVQTALTAQGYTPTRAANLDNLDELVSQAGLTTQQATMLLEVYKLLGLDPTKPLVVTPTTRKVPEDGSDIDQTLTKVGNVVTVQRQ